ncbi:hypothetical protein B9Y28_11070 [Staphylococcus aureus]|nr:hypothetical protein [Staphylococcus aureus]PSN04937.1 hypothetical protein B9Y28_11070 [Staphylococcus aureus]
MLRSGIRRRIFDVDQTQHAYVLYVSKNTNISSVEVQQKSFLFNEHYGFFNLINDDSNIVKQGLM